MKKRTLRNICFASSFCILCTALAGCSNAASRTASRSASSAASGSAISSVPDSGTADPGSGVSAAPSPAASGDTAALKDNLQDAGFTVSEGSFYEFDTIEMASQGKLASCFGNNAGSAYTIFNMPDAPGQTVPNPYFSPEGWTYKLRADEAIVLVTPLPPECKYYSFINYLMFTGQKAGKDYSAVKGSFTVGDEASGLYAPIFGSVGDSVNMTNIKHTGSSEFGGTAVILITANKTVEASVKSELTAAGFADEMINVMELPEKTYKMGIDKGDDVFTFLGRISQPAHRSAYDEYVTTLADKAAVYRITPNTEVTSDPYDNPTVIPRGTGVHEAALLTDASSNLDEIRANIIAQYADDYTYEELSADIAVPEGLTAYYNDKNALGDNRDAAYVMTPDFTLDSDEDFVVVYGVNHTKTGKGQYSNAVLYARPMLNGVVSVYDSMFEGSADTYLSDTSEADNYYVYKLARTEMDNHTAVIPYSTGNPDGKYYGADTGSTMIVAFRSYIDQTGVGASYYELIYDRTIVFHKK